MSNSDEIRFPHYLLKRSKEERFKYFDGYTMAHTVIDEAFTQLKRTILMSAGKQLIFVIGPTGAGKTFLMEWITNELKNIWSEEQHTDHGRIPVVGIEVPSKDRINPSISDIYYRVLEAMEEPLIDKKIIYGDVTIYRDSNNSVKVGPRVTTTKLRHALEKALKHRRPFALLLDEGQHLMDFAGLSIEDIMDWIKSLANMTQTLIVLFGTYEMLSLLDLSDQLMKRSRIIHLRRYKNSGRDKIYFQSTIFAFQRNMPFPKEPKLVEHWEYLYERSVGCVGNLRDWMVDAYHNALYSHDATSLTIEHLRECAPLAPERAKKMHESISKDEARFLKDIGEEEAVDKATLKAKGKISKESDAPSDKSTKVSTTKRKPRVGHRKPARDKTGRTKKAA
jgi:hypothetical protein